MKSNLAANNIESKVSQIERVASAMQEFLDLHVSQLGISDIHKKLFQSNETPDNNTTNPPATSLTQ